VVREDTVLQDGMWTPTHYNMTKDTAFCLGICL